MYKCFGFALVFAPVLPPMFALALSIDTAKPNLRAKFIFREWMDLLSGTDVALLHMNIQISHIGGGSTFTPDHKIFVFLTTSL